MTEETDKYVDGSGELVVNENVMKGMSLNINQPISDSTWTVPANFIKSFHLIDEDRFTIVTKNDHKPIDGSVEFYARIRGQLRALDHYFESKQLKATLRS